MKLIRRLLSAFGLLVVGGVSGAFLFQHFNASTEPSQPLARGLPVYPLEADPADFRVFPCTRRTEIEDVFAPCLLVSAGGKRLVFGAPVSQDWRGIGYVDAVLLMNGHPMASGGLIGLRAETWLDGRDGPLLVVAGDVQIESLQAQDTAQSASDAILQVENPLELEFRNAGLRAKPVPVNSVDFKVFDTGDLQVFASSQLTGSGDQLISYRVVYAGESAGIIPCGVADAPKALTALIVMTIENSTLTDRIRKARNARLNAQIAEARRIGTQCPSLQRGADIATTSGATKLIAVTSDPADEPNISFAGDLRILSSDARGVSLLD